jgi:hypothetical protein
MYYLFEPAILPWGGGLLQAEPVGDTATHQMRKPHWWEAEPWIPPPPRLTFAISSKAPLVDNYSTGGMVFDLYSARLVRLLRDAEVRFETFPVKILDKKTHEELTTLTDKKTGKALPVDYEIFHLLERRSRKEARADQASGNPRLMFREADHISMVFIHEDLKVILDREKITGCEYTPGDRYGLG